MALATNFSPELSVGFPLHCVLAWFHVIFDVKHAVRWQVFRHVTECNMNK